MRNQWFIWILVAGVGVFVLFVFNYQSKQDSISLTEIFPDQKDSDIEYEFVKDGTKEAVPAKTQAMAQPAQPAQPKVQLPTQSVDQVTSQPQAQSQTQIASAAKTAPSATAAAPVKRVRQFGKVNEWTTISEEPAPAVKVARAQTPARVESPAQTESARAASPSPRGNVPYTIQISSYNDRQSAEVALKGIQAAGYPAYIGARDLGAKGTKYRIYVGKYQSKAEADQSLSQLKGKYRDSFIISPKLEQ